MDHLAIITMHTPTGPTHCCMKHARQLERLMRMLGAHTNAVKAPEGAECENCKNEAKFMTTNAEVSGAGTVSAGLPGSAANFVFLSGDTNPLKAGLAGTLRRQTWTN